ncbi:MAG: hypothetical protein K2K46_08535 [Lachnospiraceae bacterium]|nr:hypothetical protein [Lachnospiraceae bacterium]
MKAKIIMLIDTMCIIITIFYIRYIDNRESYGMEALDDVGKVVIGLGFLGVEVLILIIVCIIMIYKRFHNR